MEEENQIEQLQQEIEALEQSNRERQLRCQRLEKHGASLKKIADDLKFTNEYKQYGYLTQQDLLVFKNNLLAENRKKRE